VAISGNLFCFRVLHLVVFRREWFCSGCAASREVSRVPSSCTRMSAVRPKQRPASPLLVRGFPSIPQVALVAYLFFFSGPARNLLAPAELLRLHQRSIALVIRGVRSLLGFVLLCYRFGVIFPFCFHFCFLCLPVK